MKTFVLSLVALCCLSLSTSYALDLSDTDEVPIENENKIIQEELPWCYCMCTLLNGAGDIVYLGTHRIAGVSENLCSNWNGTLCIESSGVGRYTGCIWGINIIVESL